MRRIVFLTIATTLLFGAITHTAWASNQAGQVSAQADFSEVDAYLESEMDRLRVPGLALVVVERDQIAYTRGYGTAGGGRPVTPQTPFMIGSTGKSITALAVMQQVEAGKIDLGERVQTYLPWFSLADAQAASQITVRMLLGHLSGLPTAALENRMALSSTAPDALEEQIRALQDVHLAHTPGSVYEYANANYQTLGLIVQVVSGQPYERYIQDHIFTPLGMENSYTLIDEARAGGLAHGYTYWFGYPLPFRRGPFSLGYLPSGNHMLSAEDFGRYLLAHLNQGRAGDGAVLSEEGFRILHTPMQAGYAMGWAYDGGLLSHNGAVPGYGSSMLLDPGRRRAIALIWNVNTGGGFPEIYDAAYNVQRILTGSELLPQRTDKQYLSFQTLLLGGFAAVMVWIVISLLALWRWASGSGSARAARTFAGVSSLLMAGLAGAVIYTLASQGGTIPLMLTFVPDLTLTALALITAAITWVALFPMLIQRALRSRAARPSREVNRANQNAPR